MNQKNQRGFGAVTLLVIIAIVLIVGGYMYYQNQSAAPVGNTVYPPTTNPTTPNPTPAPSATVPTEPVGQMEEGSSTSTPTNP